MTIRTLQRECLDCCETKGKPARLEHVDPADVTAETSARGTAGEVVTATEALTAFTMSANLT